MGFCRQYRYYHYTENLAKVQHYSQIVTKCKGAATAALFDYCIIALWKTFLPLRIFTPSFSISSEMLN